MPRQGPACQACAVDRTRKACSRRGVADAGYSKGARHAVPYEDLLSERARRGLAGPAGIAARLAQLIFHVVEALLELGDLVFFGRDFYVFVVDVFTRVAFA